MTGSRGPRCPGPTSRPAAPAWRSPGRSRRPRRPPARTARSAIWPISAPGTASGPCRISRACAASTRDCRVSGPPAASSRREASRSRPSSSAFSAPIGVRGPGCPARPAPARPDPRPPGWRPQPAETAARPDRPARCARATRPARAGSRPAPRWRRRVRRRRAAPAGSACRRPRVRAARWPPARQERVLDRVRPCLRSAASRCAAIRAAGPNGPAVPARPRG